MLMYETETKEMTFNNIEERDKAKELYEGLGWEVIETSTMHFPACNAKGEKSTLTRHYLIVNRFLNHMKMKG